MRIRRTLYFLIATLALLFFTFAAQGEEKPFITKWKGEAGKELKIPIFGTGYKLVIKKASDNSELKTEASLTITEEEHYYKFTPTEDGELLVEAGPEGVKQIRFVYKAEHRGSAENLLKVEKFGTVAWESMREAFLYCKNMQFSPTVGTPDLSNVTDMMYVFYLCSSFNQDLSSWNVSNVTNMAGMFDGCSSFNQALSGWNVSNVTNMAGMFHGCSAFNQDLGMWKLKKCRWLDLTDCGMSVENYSKSLIGWAAQTNFNQDVILRAYGMKYNNAGKVARKKLVNEKYWHIEGDEPVVSTVPVTGVSLSQTELSLEKGKTATLTATVAPSDATNQKVTWNSNNTEVATVEDGTVTAVAGGKATITVTTEDGGHTATCEVSVTVPATGVSLSQTELSLAKGGTATITATVAPSDATNQSVTWSSNNTEVATVEDGTVTAVVGGKATITATTEDGSHTATCEVTVTIPVTGVSLSQTELSLSKGGTATITATVAPSDATNQNVTWSSDNTEVATVEDGTVTAVSGGKATITVTTEDGSHTATCEVTVTIPVTGVSLSQTELSLSKGGTATITATVAPPDATNQNVTWSSNNTEVATVENGTVTAVSEGNATITVTTEDGSHTATCEVTVTFPVTGVSLSQTELSLSKGGTATLTATVAPSDATNKNVTWSSNNTEVATVEDGTVTAVSGGKATITVTTEDGGHTATCSVIVKLPDGSDPVDVTGVKLFPATLPLKLGTSHTLITSVEPTNATNKAVTWSSSNEAVATVSDKGLVEAKTVGTATITVTTKDGGHTATCEVSVTAEDIVLTGITISPSETTLEVDKETTLSLTFVPVTATHKDVKWSSSDPTIATVDEHGKVKGIAEGKVTITVVSEKYETINNTCSVTVTPPAAVEDAVFANVTVSPNPFETQLRISHSDVRGKYALYNTQGLEVASGALEGAETRINTALLPAGMYLLRLTVENGAVKTYRVVKQ